MVSSLVRAQSAYAHFMMHAPTHPHMCVLMHALMHAHTHVRTHAHTQKMVGARLAKVMARRWWGGWGRGGWQK